MKFALATIVFAATALAVPTGGGSSYDPCPDFIYDTPQCCATDIGGIAGLNCANPKNSPSSKDNFVHICADVGQQARCCLINALGIAVLCNPPV